MNTALISLRMLKAIYKIQKNNFMFYKILIKNLILHTNMFPATEIKYITIKRMFKTSESGHHIKHKNALLLACEPIPVVRVGFIGLGTRASRALKRYMYLEGVEIKALCDILPSNIEQSQEVLIANNRPKAIEYSGNDVWKEMCQRTDIDLIYICTDWLNHTPMAVYAMECGKHVAVEVPAATTVDECWQLVNAVEKTRRHCMMLENCCYDFFELTTLNMVQQGVFGEIIHGEGAYIHDLRKMMFAEKSEGGFHDFWQKKFNMQHTGNPYPTHGLGPICQAMNIHRGDKMNFLVSMSTKQMGMSRYAKEKFGEDSPEATQQYKLGDMNTTLIQTEKGRTIMLQHDMVSPRPYSRIHLLSGSSGYLQKYPIQQIALEPNAEEALSEEAMNNLLKKYEHPFVTLLGEKAIEVADIRARDFIMDYRLIYCLRKGLPLDQDVYDAAEWSCIVELSEKSVLNGSVPIEIPDFTRGAWNELNRLKFAE